MKKKVIIYTDGNFSLVIREFIEVGEKRIGKRGLESNFHKNKKPQIEN